MEGLHLLCKFEECECDINKLVDFKNVKEDIFNIVDYKSTLKAVANKFFSFNEKDDDQFGWTGVVLFAELGWKGVVLLAESHISIHTYPELKALYADVFTCNYTKNNDEEARLIFRELQKLFKSKKISNYQEIKR